jgi:hypothetical protein
LAISAEALTFTLDNVFSGNTPAGSSPWATATFADGTGANTGKVVLTFQGSLGASGQFITETDFNFNPALDISKLTGTMSSCTTCTIVPVSVGTDNFKADGDGKYDVSMEFDSSGGGTSATRFNGSDSAVVVFSYTGSGTFNANSFNFFGTPDGGSGPFHAAAHVQGIPSNCSGWISDSVGTLGGGDGACGGTPVPEPITMFLGGTGLLALAFAARKRLFGVGGGRLAV